MSIADSLMPALRRVRRDQERTTDLKAHLRSMTPADKHEVGELIYCSINTWYRNHGCPPIFQGGPRVAEVFYDVTWFPRGIRP
ncbi:MAG TPA: hypothetical protein VFI31_13140 [Pirellulales bacterium]|nr:hypothetical protein [Pirellulales bacterium]